MRKYWIGVSGLVGLLAVVFLLSLIPLRNFSQHQKPIRVVASLDFYGEVARAVAGKYGQVTTVINNAAVDPHDYQPGTQQARALSNANLVIQNGLGYDHWLTKLVQGSGNGRVTTIDVARQVAAKKSGDNEHVWYQPATIGRLAQQLADQYSKLDPAHASYYHQRARAYLNTLQPLDQTIAQARQGVGANRRVAVSEPVFDYALENLGYQVVDHHFAKAVEDGNDPSPQDISALQTAIKNHQLAFLVENSQTDDRVVTNLVKLAHQYGVPVLKVTESKPNGLTYEQWMTKQYQQLIKIQEGEK
ncbi:metal ABC transporter solute-binding protein, Zn/Mn family [Limosilactobacillus antri]|uniref:ABC superfamily ATP binding cassette transporter, binding protein n=1 Tax=Limosilactobacillus antri DSM 16041 TaxID=525309 RepID=C8P4F9_9LACO|nr:zinc ABC transporter substrate-binding protein [Limosilactobacillus antri]EEW54579.1 ABC transporter, substrate-binding protein [Limosilactobacillus antri DSM 16041]KRK60745.1 ABC superfamily ATP binding cassette transporter, binding protein [Limosilactobacillus antri DSM 16041]